MRRRSLAITVRSRARTLDRVTFILTSATLWQRGGCESVTHWRVCCARVVRGTWRGHAAPGDIVSHKGALEIVVQDEHGTLVHAIALVVRGAKHGDHAIMVGVLQYTHTQVLRERALMYVTTTSSCMLTVALPGSHQPPSHGLAQ